MVTSNDVARAAGVSQATVSRVLAPGARVSEATRDRVMRAMHEVGYVPNAAAQALKTGRTRTVGVVVSDLANPFYPQMLEALSRAFDHAGYRLTVWIADGTKNDAALQAIREGSVDGVVFTTVTEESVELRSALERRGPVVLVNRTVPGLDCDQVSSANGRGAELVADYLIERGHARAAFIGGTTLATTSRSRLEGFSRRMAEAGHPLDRRLSVHGEYSHASGYRAMIELLESGEPIDAVFCSNDLLAFGAMDAARARGLRIPEDLWVVGYDDTDLASWAAFDLTTVRQDTTQLADTAARLLLSRIADPARSTETHELEPSLVVRGSTDNQKGTA